MARDGIDRERVPRTDPEDQSNIPEHLVMLSFRMAMFLRYDATKKHRLDDGWLEVNTMLEELSRAYPTETWKESDVLTIVETSFSKDKPRFETMERSDGCCVRATPKAGSSTGRRTHEERHRHPGWEHGNSRPFSAKASIGTFDGVWGRHDETDYVCDIQRTMLKWKDIEQMVKIKLSGSKILVPDGTTGHMTQGTLSADKQRITFDDGDQWVRQQTEGQDDTVNLDSNNGKHPAQSARALDTSEFGGTSRWEQHRVLADWTAPDDEYLNLSQGELLSVKSELEEGWAFGVSAFGQSGYFPPTYAKREGRP